MDNPYYIVTTIPPHIGDEDDACVACQVKGNPELREYVLVRAEQQLSSLRAGIPISIEDETTSWDEVVEKCSNATGSSTYLKTYNSLPLFDTSTMRTMREVRSEDKTIIHKTDGENNYLIKGDIYVDEAVIHSRITRCLSKDVHLSQLVPKFYGVQERVNGYSDASSYYMEDVDGPTMGSVLGQLTVEELMKTLLVIHSLLDYLNKTIGFIHDDAHMNNIILRGYNQGRTYKLPVVVNLKGTLIELGFCPVLVDFGISTTREHSSSFSPLSPYATPLNDVSSMYRCLSPTVHSIIDYVHTKLATMYGNEWLTSRITDGLIRSKLLDHETLIALIYHSITDDGDECDQTTS